jgi:hypothetical protein
MEDVQQIIPTLSRTKVSRNLSYPVGAELVSAALAASVQFPMLKLHFYKGIGSGLQRGHYEFLRVEYLNEATPAEEWPIVTLYKRPPQYRWEIVVQPVPRILRYRISRYIIDSALIQIAQWLSERTKLTRRGSDILAFFYDEKTEEFISRQLTRLEPIRNRH